MRLKSLKSRNLLIVKGKVVVKNFAFGSRSVLYHWCFPLKLQIFSAQ